MPRNRKSQSAAVRFGPALKALLLCLFIGGSALGYVWQKNQIHDLARQIKKREIRLQELRAENKLRRDLLSHLCSPQMLETRARELKLGLILPSPTQKIVLPESISIPRSAPTSWAAGTQMAQRLDRSMAGN